MHHNSSTNKTQKFIEMRVVFVVDKKKFIFTKFLKPFYFICFLDFFYIQAKQKNFDKKVLANENFKKF